MLRDLRRATCAMYSDRFSVNHLPHSGNEPANLQQVFLTMHEQGSDGPETASQCRSIRSLGVQKVAVFLKSTNGFHTMHLNMVGPLRESYGYRCCQKIIDQFTRWLTVIPLKDITSQSCAEALCRV